MGKILKKCLALLLSFTIIFSSAYTGLSELVFDGSFTVEANAASEADLTFTLNADGASYSVTDCWVKSSGDLVIPSVYGDLPVTKIGDSAFDACDLLTSVIIPDGVTGIGVKAFNGCAGLVSVTIPESVTIIGEKAFYGCKALKTLEIPESVTSIGNWAFCNCTSLETINIPNELTTINNYTFYHCEALKSVIIPDGVTSIGDWAFYNCYNLETVNIPDSVTNIGANAFNLCKSIVEIAIPYSVTSIGDKAFTDCRGLIAINVDENNDYYSSYDGVLYNKEKTTLIQYPVNKDYTEFSIPDTVTNINKYAFYFCGKIEKIILSDNVTIIGEHAFEYCSSLAEVVLSGALTSIGSYAFYSCNNLAYVFYNDTAESWSAISIGASNTLLSEAVIHYNSTDHTMGESVTKTEPTCTEAGTFGASCLVEGCSYAEDSVLPALGHDYSSEWTVDVEPTCTESGSKSHHCTVCDVKTEETTLPATGHSCSEEWIVDVEPTCENEGSKYHACSQCQVKVDVTVIDPLGHFFENDVCTECNVTLEEFLKPSTIIKTDVLQSSHDYAVNTDEIKTFTATGAAYIEVTFSSSTLLEVNCDKIYIYDGADTLIGTYTGSSLANKVIRVDGDTVKIHLVTDGSINKYGYYAVCQAYGNFLDCNNHLHKKITNVVDGNCGTPGYTGDVVCAICETVLEYGESVPTPEHNYSTEWTIDVEPTCTEDGSKSRHCVVCGDRTEVTTLAATGHNYSSEWTVDVEPTCESEGSKSHHCINCGDKTDITSISSLGHIYSSAWVVDVEPTCTENGVKSKHCNRCENRINETVIESLGHNLDDGEVTKAATCTEDGELKKSCQNNSCTYTETEILPATGHNYSTDWTIDVEATCREEGSKSHHCTNCGDKIDITSIPLTDHKYSTDWTIEIEPTCTEEGLKSRLCIYCEAKTDVTTINALGHSLSSKETKAPTCTETGVLTKTCQGTGCTYTETEVIKALGHIYSSVLVVDVEPTCTEDGVKSQHCNRCDARSNETVIPALGHDLDSGVVTKESTCTETGVLTKNCQATNCTYTETEALPTTDHNYSTEWTVDIEPTKTEAGEKSHHCLNCEARTDITVIPASGDFTYTLNSEGTGYILSSCTQEISGSVTVPSMYDGLPVTEIGKSAFYSCKEITSIMLPDSITVIDNRAFEGCEMLENIEIPSSVKTIGIRALYGCKNLKEVEIPNSVTTIGAWAFSNCKSLIALTIPGSVTSIGDNAFVSCDALEAINVEESNNNYSSVDGVLYNNTKTTLIQYPINKDKTEFTVPDTVTSINKYAFYYCSKLEKITLSDNLTTIGGYAFGYCSNLKAIVMPESVTNIAACAFNACNNLEYVFYSGTAEQWSGISIASSNTPLTDAIIHYSTTDHTLVENTDNKTPTCTEDGVFGVSCSVDGCTYTEITVLPATGHDYSEEWTIDVEATCEIDGSKSRHCTICGDKTDVTVIEKTGHSCILTYSQKTSCESDGYSYYSCTKCTTYGYKVIDPATGHSYSEWETVYEPTCTEAGSKSKTCSSCGDTQIEEIVATGHSYSEWETDYEPTCTEAGSKYKTCLDCGAVATEEIAATGHNYSLEWTIDTEPTCEENGLKSHHCTVCDDKTDVTVIETLGHICGEWEIDYEPTCSTAGSKYHTCSRCGGKVDVTSIEPLGHYFENDVCVKCDIALSDALIGVVKTGVLESAHPYGNSVNENKSFTSPGAEYIEVVFSDLSKLENSCDNIYIYDVNDSLVASYTGTALANQTIIVDGDTVKIKLTTDHSITYYGYYATCTAYGPIDDCSNHLHKKLVNVLEEECATDGYTGDVVCAVCETVIESGESIPAFGHSYSTDWTIDLEPTCTTEGSKSRHCTVCDDKTDITSIASLGHSYSEWETDYEPTCTETGSKHKTCSACGDVATEEIAATGHNYSLEWTIDTEPTCEENGSKSHHCTACDDKADVTEIEALGHICGEWEIDYEPTCEKAGSKFHTCSRCGGKVDVTSIEPLGHYFENDVCIKCGEAVYVVLNGSVIETGILQSSHNYSNYTNETKTFVADGADYIEIIFSSSTSVESNYDYIYIYDGSDTLIGTYTGTTLANKTINVKGDTVKIQLTSDSSEVRYGYYATCKGWSVPITCSNHLHKKLVNVSVEGCVTDGYTGDVVCAVCEYVLETGENIPAFGHDYSDEWTIDTEVSCGADGSKSRHCITCGDKTDITSIAALGHYFENNVCVKCNENIGYALGTVVQTEVLQSSHNYSSYTSQTKTFTASDADYVTLAFSSSTYVENYSDYIYIYDGSDNLIGKYTGGTLAGKVIIVEGDTAKIKLTSNGSYNYYGYYATCNGYVLPDTCNDHLHTKFANVVDMTCTNDGYTGDVVCAICERVLEKGEVIPAKHNYMNGYCTFCNGACPFSYEIEDGEVRIYGYSGNDLDVTVPQTIDGYPVTCVEIYNSDIICINIPGNNTEVSIQCSSIVEIVLGEGVTSFDFWDSSDLVAIEVDENNAYYSDIDGVLFNKDQTTLIKYPCQKTEKSFTVPETVTRIESEAFINAEKLETIAVGDNLSSIGVFAFTNTGYYNNSSNWENGLLYIDNYLVDGSLEDLFGTPISVKEGTTIIADELFYMGALLATTIDIPSSVKYLGAEITIESSFLDIADEINFDSSLVAVNVDSNNEHYTSENGVLFNKNKTELIFYPMEKQGSTYQIPSSVEKICGAAFVLNENIRDIVIPSTVKTVGDGAFALSALDSVVVEDGVSKIGDGCFAHSEVEDVVIGNVDYIGNIAFYLSAVERVVLGNVGYIGESAFFALNTKYLELCGKIDFAAVSALFVYDGVVVMSADSITTGEYGVCINYGALYFDGTPEQLSQLVENEIVVYEPEYTRVIYGTPYEMGQYGNFLYIVTAEGNVEIYDYIGNEEEVIVPAYIGNKPVTSIGATFKNYNLDIYEEIIPTNLKRVVIPETVTELSLMAFLGNVNLTDIVLPSDLKRLYSLSFAGTGYESDEANWEDGVLYIDNYLIKVDGDCGEKLKIKNGTTLIANEAIDSWDNEITSISIPESVKYIGKDSVENCDELAYIFYGGSEEAWSASGVDTDSENLSDVIIHYNTLDHIASDWIVDFEPTYTTYGERHKECTVCGYTLKTEKIPALTGFEFTAVDVNSYKLTAYNGAAGDITIPATYNNCPVVEIEDKCFRNNITIENVIIPSSVTEIGYLAFFNCTNLETVYVSSSVTTIGSQAFNGFTGTIICYKGSYAHQYAIDNGLKYRVVSIEAASIETVIDFNSSNIFTSVEACTQISRIVSCPSTIEILPVASFEGAGVEYYGTGTELEVFEGSTYIGVYNVIVQGDTNGDSVCDVLDCVDVERATSDKKELSGDYFLAADSNEDEVVDIIDYQAVINKAVS